MKKHLFIATAIIFLLCSCGTARKTASPTENTKTYKMPTLAEADSIMGLDNAAVYVLSSLGRPVIYAMTAHKDSSLISVHCKTRSLSWVQYPTVTYCYSDEHKLPLKSGPTNLGTHMIDGTSYLTFKTLRENDGKVENAISMYQPETESLYSIIFSGQRRQDGKVYGQTNLSMQTDETKPQLVWADSLLRNEPGFIALSKEQIMSDQAIEWWLEKNPTALSKATTVKFGTIPSECTLVQQYTKASKESSKTLRAALFDTEDYTVIVAQNRSTGVYSLVWVEPKCLNPKTDRLLNSIYFSSGNRLTLFYYKGSRTFKYNLYLSSGSLEKF